LVYVLGHLRNLPYLTQVRSVPLWLDEIACLPSNVQRLSAKSESNDNTVTCHFLEDYKRGVGLIKISEKSILPTSFNHFISFSNDGLI